MRTSSGERVQCADERWGEGATAGHDWMRGALRAVLCTCAEPCTCFVNVMSLHVRTFFHVGVCVHVCRYRAHLRTSRAGSASKDRIATVHAIFEDAHAPFRRRGARG